MDANQTNRITRRLMEMYDPGEIDIWWSSEQKLLGGRRPIDCDPSEVERLLDQIEAGVYL